MKNLLLFSFCLLAAGCGGGPKVNGVSGTVKLKGGAPVTQGNIQFSSGKYTGYGVIGPDGRYSLSETAAGAGVPEGTYKVVLLTTEIGGGYDKPNEKPKKVIDPKYEDQAKTPLEVKVPGGNYDFEVDPFAG